MMFTRDEWMQALVDAGLHDDRDDQDAVTIMECSDMLGIPRDAARRRLMALENAGKATRTMKYTQRADGKMFRMMAWKLVETDKPKRKTNGRSR